MWCYQISLCVLFSDSTLCQLALGVVTATLTLSLGIGRFWGFIRGDKRGQHGGGRGDSLSLGQGASGVLTGVSVGTLPRIRVSVDLNTPLNLNKYICKSDGPLEGLTLVCVRYQRRCHLMMQRTVSPAKEETSEGGRGISVSPLSGISGLSVWSHFSISSLVLLPNAVTLSVLSFSDFGPFSWSLLP